MAFTSRALMLKEDYGPPEAAHRQGKGNVGGEPKRDGDLREIMPADSSNPAQRNERGFRHVPPTGARPSEELAAYLSPTGVAKVGIAVSARTTAAPLFRSTRCSSSALATPTVADPSPQQADRLGVCQGIP